MNQLKEAVNEQDWSRARSIADALFQAGEQSVEFWIYYATIFQAEGNEEAYYECVAKGIQEDPENYELYYMLALYYENRNVNQAYLCMEQAVFYCKEKNDLDVIAEEQTRLRNTYEITVHPASIVILSYNIADIMKDCIQSIREHNPQSAYEIVVVDNASTDGITEWLKEQKDIVLQCNKENSGFAKGCNQGIALAQKENDILLLNNDIIVPANALFWLRMGLYERDSVGATGPMTNYAANDQCIEVNLTKEQWLDEAVHINIPAYNPYEHKIWLVGFAMLIKRKVVDEIGGLDLRYQWGNYEDNDYGTSITDAGYELLLCHNSFIYHYGSTNMKKDKEKYIRYMMMNREKLTDKWGFDQPFYSMCRQEVLNELSKSEKKVFRLIEIGCGCGATLGEIVWRYPDSVVVGVEADEKLVHYGKYMADITYINEETVHLPFEKNSFDIIICHSRISKYKEEKVNQWIREYIKPDGVYYKLSE